jgi:peroxisomal membrane protein 4
MELAVPANAGLLLMNALAAFRNAVVYGAKVRAPHTLVVNLVWSRSTPEKLFWKIVNATREHALNLGKAALVFKLGTALLQLAQGGPKPQGWHQALMGAICGFLFWGDNTAVNVQVNMYILSRIISALLFLAIKKRGGASAGSAIPDWVFGPRGFRLYAASIWGIVMWLFYNHSDTLQASLKTSMGYIYEESTKHGGSWEKLIKG